MPRNAKRAASPAIPKEIKAPKPARARRTSAFASADPSVRERLPADALLVADRFRLVARGAGMEAVDLKTSRSVAFPKKASGIVQALLEGLFSNRAPEAGEPAPAAEAGMPETFREPKLKLLLTRKAVKVDPLHPTRILPDTSPTGLSLQAYVVRLGRRNVGHVLCAAAGRVQVSVPELQQKITSHTSLDAAVQRVKDVAGIYLAMQAKPGTAGRPMLPGRKS